MYICIDIQTITLPLLTGSGDHPAHLYVQKIEKRGLNSNEATHRNEGVEEIVYNYPQMNFDSTLIEAKQNEAYAINIVAQGNEAYATNIVAQGNEVYATNIVTQENKAYAMHAAL